MTFLLIILITLFGVLILRDYKLATIALIAALPIYLIRFSIGPIPFTLLEVLILLYVGLIFTRNYKEIDFKKLFSSNITKASVGLIVIASISVFVADDTLSALGFWKAYFVEPILIFFTLTYLITSNKIKSKDIFTGLNFTVIFLGIFAIFQYLTGFNIPVAWIAERRITSVFQYPNALGLFVTPLVTANILMLKARKNSALTVATIAFGIISFILSQTEAAIVAIPTATVITLMLFNPNKKTISLAGISAGLIVIGFILSQTIREKLLLLDTSGLVRRSQWKETLALLKDHPFGGTGLGGYKEALLPYHNPTLYEIFEYPHNIILNAWVELGILGVFIGFLIGGLIYIAVKKSQTIISIASFGALLTMIIHGFVDVPYFKNDLSIMTWAFVAIIVAEFIISHKNLREN